MRRFLLIFAILFLAPIIGHAATCTSTETVTKCAKIPTTIYGYEYKNGQYTSDSWSLEYNDVVLSGNSATISGYDATIPGFSATCTINSPFNASIDGILGLVALDFYTAYQACTRVDDWDMKIFSFTSKLDGDICPDGFYTVPYNISCGAGMVDTTNVPNCSDDTSGESCLIPATSAPAPEYKFTATISSNTSGFSFKISAAGTFYVDWGDGTTETIEKPDTTNTTYSHNYSTTDTYTIKIGGLATAYNSDRTFASISFNGSNLESIDGSLGAIFPTLSDGSQPSFYKTFYACSSLTSIPETLFSGVTGNAPYMFSSTFVACYGLTSIPENLFAGITGAADRMFERTFWNSRITSIPENLFSGITGAAEGMFERTFMGCTDITSIPENLFSGITGAAEGMFRYTFQGCTNLTSIPENLFSGVTGAAEGMFERTFDACHGLTSIPENLFSGIVGGAPYMFAGTFGWCSGLTSIPENLFSGIVGGAPYMFAGTFVSTSITSIPENLFAGITGAAAGMFNVTFSECTRLTGPSARINGMPLYELWPGNVAKWGGSMYEGATGLSDYACIPTVMGGGGETCAPAPGYKFSISAYDTSSFSFKISAAGTFYVDWGDGNTETIEKPDTTDTTYSHNYSTADTYTIKIGGLATAYNSSRTVASISFEDNMDIESIDGSLSAIFPTLSDGSQPSFYKTFFACYSLADIPETMFSGVTGNAPYMFSNTFAFCEGLTSIPENLFSGITGAAEDMFASTFMGCAGITNIPEKLFAGVTGSAPDLFNGTFDSCFSLTSIPENLFSGITDVADGMFEYTFQACNMLTGPSARINGKYLYEWWPDNIAEWGNSMYFDSTGLDDYACIPTVMGGGGETCEPAPEYKFTATIDLSLYDDNIEGWGESVTEFGFNLGAAGTFYVDWGDGNTETINKDNTDAVTYTHDYGTTSGTYTVKISGLATDYSDDEYTPAISFGVDVGGMSTYSQAITAIFGSLGAIFPTLSDASQPRFIDLFYQSHIRAIPSGLFDGIHGVPVSNMFASTFFSSNITSIPENLFSGITGAAEGMFFETFSYCSGLTGPSARINGKPLYELWPDNVAEWGAGMYDGATGLSDYACIPTDMGGGGETCEPAPEVLCTIGVSQIKISTGVSFALYAEKYTQPSLAIKYNDGICYGKLEQGNQSGTMNFNYNGTVYHLAN